MSNQTCLICPEQITTHDPLPDEIASQIEDLRQERLRSFAEQPLISGVARKRSSLERRVDNLLDTLSVMHRLEQLAAYVARGGQITVDADRLLVAEHFEMYQEFLDRFTGHEEIVISNLLLTPGPRPLD